MKKLEKSKNMKKRKKNGRLKSQLFFSCRLPKTSAYQGEGEGKRRVADGTNGHFKENVVKPMMFDQESMNGCSPFVCVCRFPFVYVFVFCSPYLVCVFCSTVECEFSPLSVVVCVLF